MKKSSRITNTIKYFGISSATLLAAAPVVAPTVTSVLGWYGANSVFTAKSSKEAKAITELGTFDRTGYSEFDNLFQKGILMELGSNSTVHPLSFNTIEGSITKNSDGGVVGAEGVSYSTLEGLQKIAQLTGGYGSLPGDVFTAAGTPNAEDLSHYMFTNTDGSKRTVSKGLSNGAPNTLELARPGYGDKSSYTAGQRIAAGVRYISSHLQGGTVAGVLGSSVFGDPNLATLKVYIDGQNGSNTPSLQTLLQEGTITITLVATSDSGKTAQANIIAQNTTVLFKGVNPQELGAGLTQVKFQRELNSSSLLSNTSDLSSKLPDLNTTINPTGTSRKIPKNAVPTFLTREWKNPINQGEGLDFLQGYYSDWKGHTSGTPHTIEPITWDDSSDKLENYFGGSAAAREWAGYNDNEVKNFKIKTENIGAYATGSIVVPAGTSYSDLKKSLNTLRYIGTPNSSNYGKGTKVESPMSLAFDDVKPKPGDTETWESFFERSGALKNFSNKNVGAGAPINANDLTSSVVSNSFSIDVPVYGNLKRAVSPAITGTSFGYEGQPFVNNYGQSKDRVYARVNVIVYDKKWDVPSLGTKPSFLMFTKSNNSNVLYPSIYDDGATLSQTELPEMLGEALKFSVNDSRFTKNGSEGFSSKKLASYVAEKFGQTVVKKRILISDEDKATSNKKVDISNLAPDQDFPHADEYTVRSNIQGKNISVDASKVDLSKPGSGTLTITYTNSKNERGIGTESSTITVPYQVGVTSNPVFYFVDGTDQTIKEGDNFNPMMFKVTPDQTSMDELVKSGKVFDRAPYINDPTRTGLNVTVSGSVDSNKPGNYVLTYVAKNVASGAVTTMTRNITVIAKSDSNKDTGYDTIDFKTVGYVNYVPGYGINVYNAPNGTFTGQRLPHASAWKILNKSVSKSDPTDVWYEVGKNQWISAKYVSLTPVSTMKKLSAVGTINYVPGYGVKVWSTSNGTGWTGQYLQHGTSWKVFGEENGFYNVGGNQWIDKQYVELSK